MIPISEIFHSVQGEGKLSGVPSIFIRVAGCNLHCAWCDTQYASYKASENKYNHYSIEQILMEVKKYPSKHVVITGGEPTIFPEIINLTKYLHYLKKHITIETNGTCYNSELHAELISISPKLSNSIPIDTEFEQDQRANHLNLSAIQCWLEHQHFSPEGFQIKFVVQYQQNLEEIQHLLNKISGEIPTENILLMPLGTTIEQMNEINTWLIPECLRHGYRFCPRLHIYLFQGRRGY